MNIKQTIENNRGLTGAIVLCISLLVLFGFLHSGWNLREVLLWSALVVLGALKMALPTEEEY